MKLHVDTNLNSLAGVCDFAFAPNCLHINTPDKTMASIDIYGKIRQEHLNTYFTIISHEYVQLIVPDES